MKISVVVRAASECDKYTYLLSTGYITNISNYWWQLNGGFVKSIQQLTTKILEKEFTAQPTITYEHPHN